MIKQNRRAATLVAVACLVACGVAMAAAPAQTPFKLGTFQVGEREFADWCCAIRSWWTSLPPMRSTSARTRGQPKLQVPADMKEIIARYDADAGSAPARAGREFAATQSAPFIHHVDALKILPPVRPALILNAGANYPEHAAGIVQQGARAAQAAAGGAGGAPGAPPVLLPALLPEPVRRPVRPRSPCPDIWDRAPGRSAPGESLPVPEVAHHGGGRATTM